MKIKHAKYCMHSKYVHRPIPNVSTATKIRLREHFTAEIFYRQKYPELRYLVYCKRLFISDLYTNRLISGLASQRYTSCVRRRDPTVFAPPTDLVSVPYETIPSGLFPLGLVFCGSISDPWYVIVLSGVCERREHHN